MKDLLKNKEALALAVVGVGVGLFAAYFIGELAFLGGRLKGWRESERAFNDALENGFILTPPSEGLVTKH